MTCSIPERNTHPHIYLFNTERSEHSLSFDNELTTKSFLRAAVTKSPIYIDAHMKHKQMARISRYI